MFKLLVLDIGNVDLKLEVALVLEFLQELMEAAEVLNEFIEFLCLILINYGDGFDGDVAELTSMAALSVHQHVAF